jgi:putative tricarboxylic transport membrane protein
MSSNVKTPGRFSKTVVDIVLLVCTLVFVSIVFVQSLALSELAGLVPKLVSGVAIILCLVQLTVEAKKLKAGAAKQEAEPEEQPATTMRWYTMLMIVGIYIAGLELLGFAISTLLFLLITPYVMQQKKIKINIILAVVTTVIIYYGFVEVFYVRLPEGLLFEYLF